MAWQEETTSAVCMLKVEAAYKNHKSFINCERVKQRLASKQNISSLIQKTVVIVPRLRVKRSELVVDSGVIRE